MNLSPLVDKPVDTFPAIWNPLREKLKAKVRPVNYNQWLRPISKALISGDNIVISVPNKFIADWIADYYTELIEKEASVLASKSLKIRFEITEEGGGNGRPAVFLPRQKVYTPFNLKYTFENFVVGKGNQLAHAACRAVAKLPGGNYNPLFIYGGVGLGKTHLLNAIGIEILQKHPEMKLIYISAEKFMNEFIHCVQNNRMGDFRKKYRNSIDMLLIDDIQFLGGKESTQEEFFHTFNELRESHRQIILTGDKMPKEIPGLEERLRSRFEWGLIADIQPPDLETRVAILRKKAETDKVFLGDEVALSIAGMVQSNVRELEGALIRLNAFASLSGAPITAELAQEVLQNQFSRGKENGNATIESIQQSVAQYYQIKIADLKSPCRVKTLAYPRQIAMYLCKKHLKLSFPELGRYFGGKDHTTIMHACRKIERLLEIDSHLQNDIAILEKTIA